MTGPALIPVLAAPLFDPGAARVDLKVPAGLTIAQIVTRALPRVTVNPRRIRVTLVDARSSLVIDCDHWHRVKPRAGASVVIRVLAAWHFLKSVLSIVVSVAALALGQFWAPALMGGALGLTASQAAGIISLGVGLAGNFLVNALIPAPKPKTDETKPNYAISGWKNELRPDAPVPDIYGRHRVAPPYAATPHTEIVGDLVYIRAIFLVGYGPISIDDMKIGDTSLSEYDEVQTETREGLAGDLPLSLYPRQVVEEAVSAELVRPYPRDDAGDKIDDADPVETPVIRVTGADAWKASVVINLPAGLFDIDTESGDRGDQLVEIRIRQRLAGATGWTAVTTLKIEEAKSEGFYRQHTWTLPARGRWEIELTRMTKDHDDAERQSRTVWALLQTIRPEYPINLDKPLALVSVRVKATHQLNGNLDAFNVVASRRCLDYEHTTGAWVMRETRNPASLYRYALQSKGCARPVPDSGIDLDQLADFHDFCRVKGLKYDRIHDFEGTMKEAIDAICAAGRASPRHDGVKWGVVIDRPQTLIVDHVSDRNAGEFRVSRTYFQPPHAFRVPFLDETNGWQGAERLVRWPGYTGPITVTEELQIIGKTDPDEIYVEARRRMYEIMHRPDKYSVLQSGAIRTVTRGDKVMASFNTLVKTQAAARVKSLRGDLVEMDEIVAMEAGKSYAIRFRLYADAADTIGTSAVRTVATLAGERTVLRLTGAGQMPAEGALIHFGEAANDSIPLRVAGIEAGENMSVVLRLIDDAEIIDDLTDALVPPAWSGRVGAAIDGNLLIPTAPRFTSVRSGKTGTGNDDDVVVRLIPGTGSAAAVSDFKLEHRKSGVTAWTPQTIPAGQGSLRITDYAKGDAIFIRARSATDDGIIGPYTPTVSLTIGAGDVPIPTALPSGIKVTGDLGSASIRLATGSNAATKKVQIYRTLRGVALNRSNDKVDEAFAVTRGTTVTRIDGDATPDNLLETPDFASSDDWAMDAGWTIASGKATHAPGAAGTLRQAQDFAAGKWVRIAFTVSGMTAGTITPRLQGGSTRAGAEVSANGRVYDRIQAVSGNVTFALAASSSFDGSIDNAVAFVETSECVDQGAYDYFLEPQNAAGVPGPVSGPYPANII